MLGEKYNLSDYIIEQNQKVVPVDKIKEFIEIYKKQFPNFIYVKEKCNECEESAKAFKNLYDKLEEFMGEEINGK